MYECKPSCDWVCTKYFGNGAVKSWSGPSGAVGYITDYSVTGYCQGDPPATNTNIDFGPAWNYVNLGTECCPINYVIGNTTSTSGNCASDQDVCMWVNDYNAGYCSPFEWNSSNCTTANWNGHTCHTTTPNN